jgi:hypothetical protein
MQDEIWKVSVSKYFKDFCEFFLSDLNEYIDHSKGYTFLESELEKILLEAEETKRLEKSKKKEVSVPTDKTSDLELRLFFIENEDAKKYKEKFLEVKAKYPDMSFDDALDLAKSKTPKESTTVKEGFQ